MVNVSKAVAKEMKGQDVSLFAIVPDTSIANGENAFTFYAVNDNFIKKTVSKLNEGDYKNIAMVVSADHGTGWNCPISIRGICWL